MTEKHGHFWSNVWAGVVAGLIVAAITAFGGTVFGFFSARDGVLLLMVTGGVAVSGYMMRLDGLFHGLTDAPERIVEKLPFVPFFSGLLWVLLFVLAITIWFALVMAPIVISGAFAYYLL